MKFLICCIFLVTFCSCNKNYEKNNVNNPITESVLILKNFKPESISDFKKYSIYSPNKPNFIEIISYDNVLGTYQNEFSGILDTIKIKHTKPVMIVNVNRSALIQNTYYLKAGDTIFVDFSNLNNIKEKYLNKNVFTGDITRTNVKDTLSLFIGLGNLVEYLAGKEKQQELILQDSLHYVLSEKRLDSLHKTKQIYESFYKIRKQQFEYSKKAKNFNFDNITYLKNDSLIGLSEYQYFVREFTKKKFDIKTIKTTNSVYLDYKTAFDSVYQSDIYGEKAKNYLLFHYLDQMTQDFSYNDFKERFDKFKQTAEDTTLITFLEDKYLLNFTDLKKETQEIYFINSQKQKQTLSQILEDNKGKIIYVDFWASWCAPCRALMPASRELHKQYKDKDVVFLYLSIDNDFEKWQKANRDEGLSQNRFSLLAVNYPNADFYKELNLRSIPRYLLYDKQGDLVHNNAPSPDSDIIKQELDKLLQ